MTPAFTNAVVHLELQTGNLPRACGFYTRLFGWRAERIDAGSGSYLALRLGEAIEGGVVERDGDHPLWLPYVEVHDVLESTAHAERLGASVLLPPREGPAGRRSVISAPAGAQVALWEPRD